MSETTQLKKKLKIAIYCVMGYDLYRRLSGVN